MASPIAAPVPGRPNCCGDRVDQDHLLHILFGGEPHVVLAIHMGLLVVVVINGVFVVVGVSICTVENVLLRQVIVVVAIFLGNLEARLYRPQCRKRCTAATLVLVFSVGNFSLGHPVKLFGDVVI